MAIERETEAGPYGELEVLLARAQSDGPSPDLMARVLADAAAVQAATPARAAAAAAGRAPVARRGWFAELVTGLGGWSAVSGITAAGIVGLGVGLYSPDMVTGWLGDTALPYAFGGYAVTPDIGELWTESGDV